MSFTYGVVLVTYNQLYYTVQCMEGLIESFAHVPAGETVHLVVVDNGSSDGTLEWLESRRIPVEATGAKFTIIRLEGNHGWVTAINAGYEAADADWMVELNNDTIPHGDWLSRLRSTFTRFPEDRKIMGSREIPGDHGAKVGLAGPVSNNVGGLQKLTQDDNEQRWNPSLTPRYYEKCITFNENIMDEAGFLSGFCMMVSRECYEAIKAAQADWFGVQGFADPRFDMGGFDDNDTVLIAQACGYRAVINAKVFMWHYGTVSLSKFHPESINGLPLRKVFSEKWQSYKKARTKLIAIIRTKNGVIRGNIIECLDATARFADGIVVLSDGSTDDTVAICQAHPKVLEVRHYDRPFDERRDRNELIDMAREHGADWIISVDDDEIFCMTRERVVKLMTLQDPHAKSFLFKWYTFWDDARRTYRNDGIFGEMMGFRLCKLDPGRGIYLGNAQGLHCGNIPILPDHNRRITNIRVKHYGYQSAERREAKYQFLEGIDTDRNRMLIGADNYEHVRAEHVTLRAWEDFDGVSLNVITKNEGKRLMAFLEFWEPWVDEIVIVDTGSTDDTVRIARKFTDKVSTLRFTNGLDLAAARNQALANSSYRWVLAMDPDEEIDPSILNYFRAMMNDTEVDAYYLQFNNHHPGGRESVTESVRFFQRLPEIHWSRPVHENIEQCFAKFPEARIKLASHFHVQHLGFMKTPEQQQAKLDLYLGATLAYLKKHPEDPQPYFNIGMYAWNDGDFDRCEKWMKRALVKEPKFWQAALQLAQISQMRAMSNLLRASTAINPVHPAKAKVEQMIGVLKQITPPPVIVGRPRLKVVPEEGRSADGHG